MHTLTPNGWSLPRPQGFGAASAGGVGGRVLRVTSLADSGQGSLREALAAVGPRTVVFDVEGYITLESLLRITAGRLTIAGETAPGAGITIRCKLSSIDGRPQDSFGIFSIESADDVVIRHLALRPGIWPTVPGCTAMDAMGPRTCRDPQDQITIFGTGSHRLLFDHLSLSHHTDLMFNMNDCTDVTISWCLGGYGYASYPYAGWGSKDDPWKGKGLQSYGPLSTSFSTHYNVWAHVSARTPQISGLWDSRYETVYNWRNLGVNVHNIFGGVGTYANVVGLRTIAGPATPTSGASARRFQISDWRGIPGGEHAGNLGVYVEDSGAPPNLGGSAGANWSDIEQAIPYPAPAITVGGDAFAHAGAMWRKGSNGYYSQRRSQIDAQLVEEVRSLTGRAPEVNEAPAW